MTKKKGGEDKAGNASRRDFVAAAALVGSFAGAAATANAQTGAKAKPMGEGPNVPTAQPLIPKEIAESAAAPVNRVEFGPTGITGAQIFANLCKDENLAALFCAPGNYDIINNMAEVGIPCYGGRSEGNMAAAADGYSRATCEVVACSGTEGPGFAHMIMNIAQAHYANTPLLVLASNKSLNEEGSQASIQYMDQQPVTQTIRKWGKKVIMPSRIYEFGAEAFRQSRTGVPGVSHLDFPSEVTTAVYKDKADMVRMFGKDRYRSEARPAPGSAEMKRAVEMIDKAERPVIVAGHGVYWRKAWDVLLEVATKGDIAIVGTGPTRGHVPDEHRLDAGMANDALMSADLVIFVGQYMMPVVGEFTFKLNVPTIRVHPEQGDIGRNWPVDLGIVSDEKIFLEELSNRLPGKKRDSWINEIGAARNKFHASNLELYATALDYSRKTDRLHPAVIGKEVHDFLYRGKIDRKEVLSGYGSNLMGAYAGRWLRAYRPGQEIVTYYQFGAMGPDISMMIGAAAAVAEGKNHQAPYRGAPTICLTGDAGLGYSLLELDTAVKYKWPVITIVYNNDCWGMFFTARRTPRARQMYMFQENIRYDKMAEALGARGELVHTPEGLRAALQRAYDAAVKTGASTLINCQGLKDFTDGQKYPPARANLPEPGVGAQRH